MKRILISIGIIASLAGIALLAAGCYRTLFAQKVAAAFEVNNADMQTHVLIATQGSAFKDAVVAAVVEAFEQQPIYIKVIDVSGLPAVVEAEWQALVLVNTCQSSQLQPDVAAFLARATDVKKMILVTTSGSGRWQPETIAVDSISSASRTGRVQPVTTEIVNRLAVILGRFEG